MASLHLADIVGKANYAKNPELSNKNALLESNIIDICIAIMPIFGEIKNPNYAHACFVAKIEGSEGISNILIENGQYDEKREGDYKGQVHYFYEVEQGLRFVKLTTKDFKKISKKKNKLIPCSIENNMTVEQLLFDSQFCGTFHRWDYYNFNLIEQNCQLFVRKVVHILNAKRINDEQKKTKYTKKYIPIKISTALEDNENYRTPNIRKKIDKSKIKHFSKVIPTPDHDIPDTNEKYLFELLQKYDELIVRTIL